MPGAVRCAAQGAAQHKGPLNLDFMGQARGVAKQTATITVTAAAVLSILMACWIARTALLVLFAGILLAILLRTLADAIGSRLRLRPAWSLALVVVLLVAMTTIGIAARGPAVVAQFAELQNDLPRAAHTVAAQMAQTGWGRWLIERATGWDAFLPSASVMLSRTTGLVSATFALVASVAVVLFTGLYLAAEPGRYVDGVLRLVPLSYRPRAGIVLADVGHTLRWWLLARFVSMIAVGVLVGLGLSALGVPLAGTLGVIAALLSFVPNLGPVVSVIPPFLLVAPTSPERAVAVVLLFWMVHGIEGFLVSPLIERRAIHLPPALTLIAQVLMAVLVGSLGVAFAAPLVAVVLVLVRRMYLEDLLGEGPRGRVKTPTNRMQLP